MAKRIRLALDWTPNTIHTGFYVAQQRGLYEDAGLEVEIITPDTDDYKRSPAKRLELGEADVAIAPTESVISYRTKSNPVPVIAVATILAKDASAIVTLQSSGIERPAQLDGKIYASYSARFEDHIVKQMVKNDGGQGNLELIYPKRLGIWNTLLAGEADATWIFLPWEGVEARIKDVALNVFQMEDYGIPYGYSPVLLVHEDFAKKKKLRRFLKATRKGFKFAKNNPTEAAQMLLEGAQHPSLDGKQSLVEQSQVFISQYYFDENGKWGIMKNKVWENFVSWLVSEKILTDTAGNPITDLNVYDLFSNDILED